MSMVAPYYDKNGITIYHGDCLEILPHLPQVDVVLTDPPFGARRPSAWCGGGRFDEISGNDAVRTEWIKLLPVADGGAVYLFCTWDTLQKWREGLEESFRVRSCIVWDKEVHGLADTATCWAPRHELLLFAANGRHVFKNRPVDVLRCQRVSPANLLHPYEKPISLLKQPLLASSCRTVLDPFMGCGSTLRAAKDIGCKAIGIELDEAYCRIAVERLRQEVLPLEA